MEPNSAQAADDLIIELGEKSGRHSDERREELRQKMPWALRSIDGLRESLCSTTEALSRDLYSKETRFIYELIQNADDNDYSIAMGDHEAPFLRFKVTEDSITLESNENGFSAANVCAICTTGHSTKAGVKGYIGEKGIGFKSVFVVSRRVHVESGHFSFAFDYDTSEPNSSLGMVTPLVEAHSSLPRGVRSRIVLHLKPEKRGLFEDFEQLPDTLLLFLQKLKRLTIQLHRPDGTSVEKEYTLESIGKRARVLIQIGDRSAKQEFWVARRRVDDMPEEENRAATDKADRITTAEVVLAFPVSDEGPIVDEQHVFAFLPIRKAGFKFLIQSDFITQANREDIVHCAWNFRLLDEIVTLFAETIGDFLKHRTLTHQWIRYLPVEEVPDDFWALLRQKLLEELKTTKLLIGSRDDVARRPASLRFVPNNLRGEALDPLIWDCECNNCVTYVSEEYDPVLDYPILKALDVTDLSMLEFIHKLKCDVELDEHHSQWKATPEDLLWQRKLATVLVSAMKRDKECRVKLRGLPLVPLCNRDIKWRCPQDGTIFFPTCSGTDIPTDLSLALVDPRWLQEPMMQKLYTILGVSECSLDRIFNDIRHACQSASWTKAAAAEHLRFIFWNHDKLTEKENPTMVFNTANVKVWPHNNSTGWIYRPHADGDYSAAKVIGEPLTETLEGKMHFLDPLYYETLKDCGRREDRTGIQWLEEFLDIKGEPQLSRRGNNSLLSTELDYIAHHEPQYLLGLLKSAWPQVRHDDKWQAAFKALSVQVPVLGSSTKIPLHEACLPLPKLRATAKQLGLEGEFGFIQELQDVDVDDIDEWRFLSRFGVQVEEDFTFWINTLKRARQGKKVTMAAASEIYSQLQHHCKSDDHISRLRSLFGVSSTPPMFSFGESATPPSPTHYLLFPNGEWVGLTFCVWEAPPWYRYSRSISSQDEYSSLERLFTRILGVPLEPDTAKYLDYLQHLAHLSFTQERILKSRSIYEVLTSKAEEASSNRDLIVSYFESHDVVLDADSRTWYPLSNCIWSTNDVQLPSKFSLATQYGSLKSFFCGVLNLASATLDDHIQGVIDLAADSPSIDDIKRTIEGICRFNPTPQQVQRLLSCECFPVMGPNETRDWVNAEDDFAIVDRREYGTLFVGKARLLEFSLEEVHSFEVLFDALHMQKRYLSQLVESNSTATNRVFADTLTRHLRRKAFAICRHIAHYQATPVDQTPQQIFQLLETMEVYTTDDISTTLSMRQREHNMITVSTERSNVHIEETEDKLTICIPRDPKRRARSNARELPVALLKQFGVSRATAGDLASIILTDDLTTIDSILDDAGIIRIDGVERPPDVKEHSDTTQGEAEAVLTAEAAVDEPAVSTPPPQQSPEERTEALASASSRLTSARAIPSLASSQTHRQDLYRKLLAAVVDGARSMDGIPRCGQVTHCSAPSANLTVEDVEFAVADLRKKKIGAAGELLVFEWLKGLQLPGFGLDNWRSTIRHYNREHTDHRSLEAWTGTETSDIVYNDTEAKLKNLLIDQGYLDSETWTDRQAEYFIEVKATPGTLRAPFFVSSDQYRMMEDMKDGAKGKIYMVARVFNIGMAGMGMKLYLDPETLRRDHSLVFKSKTYSVIPAG